MMTRSSQPASGHDVRAAVVDRYSALARAAQAGERIQDCDPGEFTAGGFGPAGYADLTDLPDGAVRASLGCGNPVAVAALAPGETVLDLGSGGGIDVLLSARRVGPAGKAYGLDASADMISNCVINLSADKPRVLAEIFRVLRPGGRLGVSDMIAEDGIDPDRRAAAEHQAGCTTGTITAAAYRDLLEARGFTGIRVTVTNDTGMGVQSAIIQAERPA
jgi:SAM-dependent methyltransferase